MAGVLICDPRFEDHKPGPRHPEGPDRVRVMMEGLGEVQHPPWEREPPRKASESEILSVHESHYLERVREASAWEKPLDADTRLSARSYETALWAAGSSLYLARQALDRNRAGFVGVRPPGHHAEPGRGMGFCLFNNIAIAAQGASRRGRRVAILDIDVHHGNGTQKIFYDRSDVFYVSFHQYPFYPGTGSEDETGSGEGEGCTLNIPLEAGSGWPELEPRWENTVQPAIEPFQPEIVMVSAGFDAHETDPIGGLNLSDRDFLRMAADMHSWAQKYAEGRIVGILEGGYNRDTLRRLVPRFTGRLFGVDSPKSDESEEGSLPG